MAASKILMLLRHGSTDAVLDKKLVGRTDIPINAEGRRQAQAMAPYIAEKRPDRRLCSPLLRARQTAEIVIGATGLDIEENPDLREIDFGRWEQRTFQEISASEPELVERWAAWEEDFSFPEGESLREFAGRVRHAADYMMGTGTSRVLAVTHGGVIRAMICHLLGLSMSQYLLFDIKPASLTTIEVFDGRGVLIELRNPPQMAEK
jgi:alpha-ribazole phosphatase